MKFTNWESYGSTKHTCTCLHFEEEDKAGCFALHMYSYYKCSVVLPHGAAGSSAVCDCGIS